MLKHNFLRTAFTLFFLLVSCVNAPVASACIGNTIVIGTSSNPASLLAAELVSQFINERTGTATKIIILGNYEDAEDSLVSEDDATRVDILFENHVVSGLGFTIQEEKNNDQTQENYLLKKGGKSFGGWRQINILNSHAQQDNSMLYRDTLLKDFPLLPRLLTKIKSILEDNEFKELVLAVETGEKAKNVARKVLQKKNFI